MYRINAMDADTNFIAHMAKIMFGCQPDELSSMGPAGKLQPLFF